MTFKDYIRIGRERINLFLNYHENLPESKKSPCVACGGQGFLLRTSTFNRVNEDTYLKDKNGWDIKLCDAIVCPPCSGTGVHLEREAA